MKAGFVERRASRGDMDGARRVDTLWALDMCRFDADNEAAMRCVCARRAAQETHRGAVGDRTARYSYSNMDKVIVVRGIALDSYIDGWAKKATISTRTVHRRLQSSAKSHIPTHANQKRIVM